MRKLFIYFSLIFVIIISFGFVIFRTAANGPEDNFFNRNFRERLARTEFFRAFFDLKSDGDAKADYLGGRYKNISIEVDEMSGLSIPDQSLDLLAKNIASVTGKQVSYFVSDKNINYENEVTPAEMTSLANQYRNSFNHGDTAVLYLMYISQLSDDSKQIGSTLDNYAIVLFDSPLEKFAKENSVLSFNNYVASTALHEFGHQLGLKHNDFSDCLMQPYLDVPDFGIQTPENVITDFCNYEKELINSQKAKL